MQRGEVWWVNFDPAVGGEIRKERPAVIVSNNLANKYLNRVQVVPLSTSIDTLYPSEAYVMAPSKALADKRTTVSTQRFSNKLGELSAEDLQKVEQVIKIQLDLLL
jgi:mRNA interferase MazF